MAFRRHSGCAGGNRRGSAGIRCCQQQAPAMVAARGWAPPMPPRPPVRDPFALQAAAVVLAPGLDEGLIGALHDALRADVDPRAGGHLAVHHQPFFIQLVEMVPGRPMRHQVRVGDQHARASFGCERRRRACRTGPAGSGRPASAFRLSTIRSKSFHVRGGAADAAIDHQLMRVPRPRRDAGCSSASASAPRSASFSR